MKKPVLHSLGHALLAGLYVLLVVQLISHAQAWFGNQENSILIPLAMIMLFVLSATIVGALVLGRPTLMYLDGRKKEALEFFGYTLGWFFTLTLIAFIGLAAQK
jgi:hypothetical protein